MIEPQNWRPFPDDGEALAAMKMWGILSPSAQVLRPVTYAGGFAKEPILCDVVGEAPPCAAVIRIDGQLHCINTEYLKDMQGEGSFPLIEARALTDKQLLSTRDYVALDFETTGLLSYNDHIIEIGAVRIVNGEEAGALSSLIDPCCHISSRIEKLTGITNEMLSTAPPLWKVAESFLNFIGGFPLIAHNAPFDIAFFIQNFSSFGKLDKIRYGDTLAMARRAFPGLPHYRLADLVEYLHIDDCANTHRAEEDARCVVRLFEAAKAKLSSARPK